MLEHEQRRSAFHLVACEPNWIYPLCNSIVAAALKCNGRLNANVSGRAKRGFVRRWRTQFIDLAGASCHAGPHMPAWRCRRSAALSRKPWRAFPQRHAAGYRAAPVAAAATATLIDTNGLARSCFWRIDTGNYRLSRASAYAGTALAAIEMGDAEVAYRCLDALDEECPAIEVEHVWHRPNASVWAHAVELFARSSRANGFRHLVENPRATTAQPMIGDVPYPDVLVARAVHADGMLAATLYPGERGGRFRLKLSGLAPGGRYAGDGLEEQSVVADASGEAAMTVGIDGRTTIQVRPIV